VCNGFLLHGGVHDHAGQFLLGDQLEGDSNFHGAGEQFFHAFFAQSFTKIAPVEAGRTATGANIRYQKILPGGGLALR
jgi:hypothetical protein